ncbi:MAG: hypothetical protein QNJ47_23840 [Nostocaceae cyanobacterium]|nr:hypothetical protein [Nostocaceae cyanobacterium]
MLKEKFLLMGLLIIIIISFNSCSSWGTGLSRNISHWSNRDAQITCYSGGKIIFQGKSDGKVFSKTNSDRYVFFDQGNKGNLTQVSGDCVIQYD